MNTIHFSHRYKKMPPGVEYLETWITDVILKDYVQLTPHEIKQDTETVDGQFYKLPETTLIVITLWSNCLPKPVTWKTMRRWTKEKYEYYKSLKGQQVKIEIK